MNRLLVLLVGVLFGALQSGVLAQDGVKFSYPRALERLESLVASLNESLHETRADLHEVRLSLNQTKKILGEVQGEKESLKLALVETRNELTATKTLYQQAINSSRVEALERQGSELEKRLKRVRRKINDLEDEHLGERISALTEDLSEVSRDMRRLEDENLPRRVSELFVKLLTAEIRHNFTSLKMKEEQRQTRSEVQMLETKIEAALSVQNEQVDNIQELTGRQNSLELKLNEVTIDEAEWESRIASSSVVEKVKLSVRALDAALTNMTAVVGNGLSDAEAKFAMLKRDVEVVEDELCAKVQNVSHILEVAKESSEQSISAIKQNIIKGTKLAAKQQESIDRLTTRVSQQGQSVNQLSDSVTDQEERLDNLTSTVEKQSSGIARLKEEFHPIKTGKQYRQISWNVYVLNYIRYINYIITSTMEQLSTCTAQPPKNNAHPIKIAIGN